MLHAVIMAGGSGTRFWPASREDQPKQLLALAGERTMIQATVDRLEQLVPPERVLIVTNAKLVAPIQKQLPELPGRAVLGEPCKRDTAPCIGLAAIQIGREDPNAIMAVMPADHVISPTIEFQRAIRAAASLVEEQTSRIVTFGIKPTYPAEIFGYIERSAAQQIAHEIGGHGLRAFSVARFREKPDAGTAQQYVDSGKFYWNSGIFVWRAAHIMQELATHEPTMFAHLEKIADAAGTPAYQATLEREFAAIKGKSIDYAVMERANDVVVIEAPFDWDDVGNWRSLTRLRGMDEHGNTIVAPEHLTIATEGTIISGEQGRLIATVGIRDCIIVQVGNVTLVAHQDAEEQLREVVQQLKAQGRTNFL